MRSGGDLDGIRFLILQMGWERKTQTMCICTETLLRKLVNGCASIRCLAERLAGDRWIGEGFVLIDDDKQAVAPHHNLAFIGGSEGWAPGVKSTRTSGPLTAQ